MYGVDGRRDVSEHELGHLEGFRDSRPVRVGNAAWGQSQLDVMGEVLDMAHRFSDQLVPFEDRTRRLLFVAADDDRMLATIHTVEDLLVRDGLVYRWDGDTNGVVICTYWLVECLALAGEGERARLLFDGLTARANDVGLFAEQIDPHSGEMTGNFPQAFSHVGLINAAWRLDQL